MAFRPTLRTIALSVFLGATFTACQGNIGSPGGLSLPQGPAPYQPGGPSQQTTSRERNLEGAVYLSSASPLPSLPLPQVAGFGIDIALGTAPPAASPQPIIGSPSPSKTRPATRRFHTAAIGKRAVLVTLLDVVAVPAGQATPGAAASLDPAGASAGVHHLSDVAAPSPAAAESPNASAPLPVPTGAHSAVASHHHTHAAVVTGPKILTKTVVYPDDAPVAPTPEPTGAVQTFPVRKPLLRGYLLPAVDVPIYGLGAIRFTVPASEITAGRGYTIAVFTSLRKHRGKLLEYDADPVLTATSVASAFADDPLTFKKGVGYELVLYADPGLATPAAPPPGYPAAGNNPFNPSAAPGSAGQQTQPPPGYPAPTPVQTYFH